MKKANYISFILIVTLFACKKDTIKEPIQSVENNPVQLVVKNFAKLAVGNYWIYNRYKVDTSGNHTFLNIVDSCYISKDTLINGKTFYKMYRPNTWGSNNSFVRDSSDCILNQYGKIIFSPNNFSLVYTLGYSTASATDTISLSVFSMNNKDSLITTSAGIFNTTNVHWVHYMYPNWKIYGRIRYSNYCYSENVGLVVETLNTIYNLPFDYERRLIRYHVN